MLLDINDRSQLNRFGLTNGIQAGFENLSEKWEGMVLLSALDPDHPDDYFLFLVNDNDFATTDGFQAGAAYNDGKDLDTMFLAYRVTISAVPEPGSALLAGLGGALLIGVMRRRRTGFFKRCVPGAAGVGGNVTSSDHAEHTSVSQARLLALEPDSV